MIIDSIYEGAISTLTSQGKIIPLSKEISTFKSNSQRVLYVYNVLEELQVFPSLIEVEKNESVSTHYRNRGNECYQEHQWYKAWQFYNLSILHAPLESEAYCLGFSNRSAVFFSMKKYSECLADIKMIFSLKYPESLEEKLKKREKECEEFIAKAKFEDVDNPKIKEIFTMQRPNHPTYLCASDKLKVVYTKAMGRHVVAAQDIGVGELIAQDFPFITLNLKSQYLFSCSFCMSRNFNLIPCEKCCFDLYCSVKCKENAWRDFHKFECKLMATLVKMEFTKLELLALRTTLKARTSHNSWQELFKTVKDVEASLNTEKQGLVNVDGEWVYDSKYYASIHSLETNIDKRGISDQFQKSVTAAVLLYLLKTYTSFLTTDEDETEVLKCVAGILLHNNMSSPTNMHGIDVNIQDKKGNYVQDYGLGSAPYAFLSLLNHSCAPNTVRVNELGSGRMHLFALRPIPSGSQLFDNYGAHHALADRMSRASHLKFQYKFLCQCEACIENWPTYFYLPSETDIPHNILKEKQTILTEDIIEKLQKGCQDTALSLYRPLCELLEKLEPYNPCKEVADCQESLKQCFCILSGVLPRGYNDIVQWDAVPPVEETEKVRIRNRKNKKKNNKNRRK